MDLSTVIPDLLKLSPIVALLVAIAWILWKRNQTLVREQKAHFAELIKRVEADTQNCKENYKEAVGRIQHLEKRTYDEGREDKAALIQCIDRHGRAIEKIADLVTVREESSLQYIVKGKPSRRPKKSRARDTAETEALEQRER